MCRSLRVWAQRIRWSLIALLFRSLACCFVASQCAGSCARHQDCVACTMWATSALCGSCHRLASTGVLLARSGRSMSTTQPRLKQQQLTADVVVVGGGMAGLLAAALLGQQRRSVVVVDRLPDPRGTGVANAVGERRNVVDTALQRRSVGLVLSDRGARAIRAASIPQSMIGTWPSASKRKRKRSKSGRLNVSVWQTRPACTSEGGRFDRSINEPRYSIGERLIGGCWAPTDTYARSMCLVLRSGSQVCVLCVHLDWPAQYICEVLARRAAETGNVQLRFEHECRANDIVLPSSADDTEHVQVNTRAPSGEEVRIRTRLVIGADGINSAVRQAMLEASKRHSGTLAGWLARWLVESPRS